ncbi:hypothetical protein BOX15_Mlig000687g5 [Macrostomum lignano]|uniref:Uncharacterized protein n=1 Tax=Macrostomum lignano TaxID=282301 RepID=A0A267E1J3_9PLAT|nr:hypothetical protein BOX15_Mlig000687g5 [Macrostomum lignano]
MASRLGGRRVSMAPNRLRRQKRDPSGLADLDEDAGGHPNRMKNAIYNEEIARLRIRDEDLNRITQEVRMEAAASGAAMSTRIADVAPSSSRRVAVRREIPPSLRRPPLRRFALLRRAAPEDDEAVDDEGVTTEEAEDVDDVWLQPRIQQAAPGPRLDSRGNVVPHSLLGRPEDFYKMGLQRGHLRPEDLPPAYRQLAAPVPADEADADKGDKGSWIEQTADQATSIEGCYSRAGGTNQRHTRNFALPAMESSSGEAAGQEVSARDHNKRVLAESGFQVRRLTEQQGEW